MTTTFSNTPGSKPQIEQGVEWCAVKAACAGEGFGGVAGGPRTGPPVWRRQRMLRARDGVLGRVATCDVQAS
jgi:hypothetical protein